MPAAAGEVILVEELRPPIGRSCICFPAGLCGDEGPESAQLAAQRELLEEAGYAGGQWEYLFEGPSSPGLSSESLFFFKAVGLQQVALGGGVAGENITVHRVPQEHIATWLQQKMAEGVAIDPRVYSGLYFLLD